MAAGSRNRSQQSRAGIDQAPDFYRLLGIEEHATPEQIKRAYRAAMKRIHPDRARPDDRPHAEQQARTLNEAYRVLVNPDLRRRYDDERRSSAIQDEIMGRYFGGFGVPGGRNDVYEEIMNAAREENLRQRKKNDRYATTSLLTMFLILLVSGVAIVLLWGVIASLAESLT